MGTYRNYHGYKRKNYKKKSNYKMTNTQKINKALSMVKSLEKRSRPELKHYDEVNVLSPINTGSVVSILRGITQGYADNDIQGNQIYLKKINLRCKANINATAVATTIRFAVLQDLRPQSATPSYTEVWNIASTTSFLNIDTWPGRFKVLGTGYFQLTINENPEFNKSFNIPMNALCKFNDAQTPVLNDIIITFISDEGTYLPQLYMSTRLRYYDN